MGSKLGVGHFSCATYTLGMTPLYWVKLKYQAQQLL